MGATEAFRCLGGERWIETEIPAPFFQRTSGLELILTRCLRCRIHRFHWTSRHVCQRLPPRRFHGRDASTISRKRDPPSPSLHICSRGQHPTSSGVKNTRLRRLYVFNPLFNWPRTRTSSPFICPFVRASWSAPPASDTIHTRSLVGPLDCLYGPFLLKLLNKRISLVSLLHSVRSRSRAH